MLESVLKQRVTIQVCILNESSATRSDPEECRGEERVLPPQSNSVHTLVMARATPVPQRQALESCHFGWLRGTSYTGVIPTRTKEGVPELFFTRDPLPRRPLQRTGCVRILNH